LALFSQEIVEFFSLSEAKVSWIVASKQVGMLVSNMVWPRLSDVLGRRAVLLFLFLLLALAPFAEVRECTLLCQSAEWRNLNQGGR